MPDFNGWEFCSPELVFVAPFVAFAEPPLPSGADQNPASRFSKLFYCGPRPAELFVASA